MGEEQGMFIHPLTKFDSHSTLTVVGYMQPSVWTWCAQRIPQEPSGYSWKMRIHYSRYRYLSPEPKIYTHIAHHYTGNFRSRIHATGSF
jgi:hypothetical protein